MIVVRSVRARGVQPMQACIDVDAGRELLATQRVALFQQCGNLSGELQLRAIVAALHNGHEHMCKPRVCSKLNQRAAVRGDAALGGDGVQALQQVA